MDNSISFEKPARQKRRDKRLHEEVIEIGRYRNSRCGEKSRKSNEKGRGVRLQRENLLDSVPMRQSIRAGHRPWLRDNLEPLERWLAAQVGRPWSKVYSDLGKIANPNSMHGAHIRQHLWAYVARKSWLDENGEIVVGHDHGGPAKGPNIRSDYFIHPKTGLFSRSADLRAPKTKGPFPEKARFKMQKQAVKSKIRQGIPFETAAQKPGTDVQDWPCFRTRTKWVSPGDQLDFLQNGAIFRAVVLHLGENARSGHYLVSLGKYEFREKFWLSVNLKIVAVFAGTNYLIGQTVHLVANKNKETDWTAYDPRRVFGNRGFGLKHWAI